jgi:ADP-heptose:LPS heptosyltransferase
MGAGDWLIAAGEARALHEATGKNVAIVDVRGRAQWVDLWNGVPYIVPRVEPGCLTIRNTSGVRPYIAMKTPSRWRWKPYQPTPAQVFLTLDEQRFAQDYAGLVMIEPNVKQIGHTNKAWIWERWQDLVNALPGTTFVQCLQGGTRALAGDNVRHVLTLTFRDAMAVLAKSRALVSTEGGLMHAAAAVGTPAVILWSEFISPEITGYKMHRNLRHAGNPCGMRLNCPSCRRSMAAITVGEVADALKDVLHEASDRLVVSQR